MGGVTVGKARVVYARGGRAVNVKRGYVKKG
jgi:hypothetical protein